MGYFEEHGCFEFTYTLVTLSIGCIGLPLTIMAMIGLYRLVRNDHVVPIYVFNLLATDVIQLCISIAMALVVNDWKICLPLLFLNHTSTSLSIFFMLVIALERYLIVAWPLWYRFRRNIKTSVIISVLVWLTPIIYVPIFFFYPGSTETAVGIFLILPSPVLVFFLAGTLKALSAAIGVPADEKRRIVATLVLVLLIYTSLFVPRIFFSFDYKPGQAFYLGTILPLYFNPLADLFLYVFMKKSVFDRFLMALCCKVGQNDVIIPNENVDAMGIDNHAYVEEEEVAEKKTEV